MSIIEDPFVKGRSFLISEFVSFGIKVCVDRISLKSKMRAGTLGLRGRTGIRVARAVLQLVFAYVLCTVYLWNRPPSLAAG